MWTPEKNSRVNCRSGQAPFDSIVEDTSDQKTLNEMKPEAFESEDKHMQTVLRNGIIMREATSQSKTPVETISRKAAVTSLAAAALFLGLLAFLQVIKPEFDPSWRFVSEYAIGDYGWIMTMAFIFLGISCASLVMAIRSHVNTTGGKIGLILLLVVAASLVAAGVFVADPITATSDQLTMHGTLHGVAAMIGIPGLPIAAVLISRGLVRNQSWFSAKRTLLWTAHLTWISINDVVNLKLIEESYCEGFMQPVRSGVSEMFFGRNVDPGVRRSTYCWRPSNWLAL
jgi:hypothetical protein